jgi:hypothetical protein
MNISETVISRIADAIACAEGWNAPASRPRRNNNPGDLEQDVTGKAIGHDGPYVIYASPEDGLDALKHQVRLMFKGSRIYNPSMTIAEVAGRYSSTQRDAWARIVAARLGVGIGTRLEDLL